MDNGNQVKDIFIQSKKRFLQDDFNALRKPREMYNLDEEFLKTKKNKNRVIIGVILLLVAVFSLFALVVTYFIQESTKKVIVKIDDFTDLGLKDILDRAKKLESDYSGIQQQYNDIQKERDDAIIQIKKDAAQQILLINSTKITDIDKKSKIDQINNTLWAGIAWVEDKYKKLLKNKQQKMDDLNKLMDQEDAAKLNLAKANEAILDNQKKLSDLQLNDKVAYYENKILAQDRNHEKELQDIDAYNIALINILNENHAQEIKDLILKNNQLTEFGIAIDAILDKKSGEIGYVIDNRDVNNIILYYTDGIRLTPGEILTVYDLNYKTIPNAVKICSIKITNIVNETSAACMQTELTSKNYPVKVFDRVIIKKISNP